MEKLQIIWGDLERTEALETHVSQKCEKILNFAPKATKLIVNLKTINETRSAGVNVAACNMELRLPNHQDVRAEKEGEDLYKTITSVQQTILSQLKAKKDQNLV